MNIDVEKWLSRLPLADEEPGNGIVLSGWLVPSEAGEIRILVGDLCLSFSRGDILEIESISESELPVQPPAPIEICVVLRRGAPILDIRLGKLCDGSLPRRRPFALAVRPPTIILGPSTRFRDLERQFLLAQSLTDT